MEHDWAKSAERVVKSLIGAKGVDRVPFFPLICEQMLTRISGKTVKELLSSPELFAKETIMAHEFIKADHCSLTMAYAGPAEALAFAEVNGKTGFISWFDYQPFMIQQGAICKTKEDIENLKIPHHSKSNTWQALIETINIIRKKTGLPQGISLGIWSVVQELRGTQAYRDMRSNPGLLKKLCEKIHESQMDLYDYWTDNLGKSPYIMFTGYSFNSHMMSFENAMEYEGEYIKQFQKDTGLPVILHNCGTKPYFDEVCTEINLAAINGSHPLDINYWIEFQKKFPNVIIIGANIDVSRELLNGTTKDVEEKVKENIFNLATHGKYMCGPICCLPWGVSMKNIMAIPNALEKYGTYPIQQE